MADTLQFVTWTIGHECSFRKDSAIISPSSAIAATEAVRAFASECYRKYLGPEFADRFVVRSAILVSVPGMEDRKICFPYQGTIANDLYLKLEGRGVLGYCAECPISQSANPVASCCGVVQCCPDHEQLQVFLRNIINDSSIANDFNRLMPKTFPLWYGLWIESPISPDKLPLLIEILTLLGDYFSDDGEIGFHRAATAIRIALRHRRQFYATLSPPGHIDMGMVTEFAHCPKCKAQAKYRIWSEDPPKLLTECHVCSAMYVPSETSKSTEYGPELPLLQDQMSVDEFELLGIQFLVNQGVDFESASLLTRQKIRSHLQQLERSRDERERYLMELAYLRKHIFVGLPVRLPVNHREDGYPEFDAASMAVVLRRCQKHRITICCLMHLSKKRHDVRISTGRPPNPRILLQQWIDEGLNERFTATYAVPDQLLCK